MLLAEGLTMNWSSTHWIWTLLALALALAARGDSVNLFASCGPDCTPSPVVFTVPIGMEAAHFRILDLKAGKYCSKANARKLDGFCIRRHGQTVFIYYHQPHGIVSDPVPLDDLVLSKGRYELLAAPARGASVRLAFELREAS
jgi:hypothetical protein